MLAQLRGRGEGEEGGEKEEGQEGDSLHSSPPSSSSPPAREDSSDDEPSPAAQRPPTGFHINLAAAARRPDGAGGEARGEAAERGGAAVARGASARGGGAAEEGGGSRNDGGWEEAAVKAGGWAGEGGAVQGSCGRGSAAPVPAPSMTEAEQVAALKASMAAAARRQAELDAQMAASSSEDEDDESPPRRLPDEPMKPATAAPAFRINLAAVPGKEHRPQTSEPETPKSGSSRSSVLDQVAARERERQGRLKGSFSGRFGAAVATGTASTSGSGGGRSVAKGADSIASPVADGTQTDRTDRSHLSDAHTARLGEARLLSSGSAPTIELPPPPKHLELPPAPKQIEPPPVPKTPSSVGRMRGVLLSQSSMQSIGSNGPRTSVLEALGPRVNELPKMPREAGCSDALRSALRPLAPLVPIAKLKPDSSAHAEAAASMSRLIVELGDRCFNLFQYADGEKRAELVRLGSAGRMQKANGLTPLHDWQRNMRWYAWVVHQESASSSKPVLELSSSDLRAAAATRTPARQASGGQQSAPGPQSGLMREGSVAREAYTGREPSLNSKPASVTAILSSLPAGSHVDPGAVAQRQQALAQLRDMDLELQRVHPCFAPARSSFSAWVTAPAVDSLRKVHESALTLHTEVLASLEVPKEARAALPNRASPLLPKEVLSALESVVTAEPSKADEAVARATARVIDNLRIAECEPELALELLERVQRAGEVWATKARSSGVEDIGSGSPSSASWRLLRAEASSSSAPENDEDSGRRGSPALFSRPKGRLARSSRGKVARQVALARAARRLSFEIRRAHPTLDLTSFESAKVRANSQVQSAMLEAYSRVLEQHAAPAVVMYQRLAKASAPGSLGSGSDRSRLSGLLNDAGFSHDSSAHAPTAASPVRISPNKPSSSLRLGEAPLTPNEGKPPTPTAEGTGGGSSLQMKKLDLSTATPHSEAWACAFQRNSHSLRSSHSSDSSSPGESTLKPTSQRPTAAKNARSPRCNFKRKSGRSPRSARLSSAGNAAGSSFRPSRSASALAASPRSKTEWIVQAAAKELESRLSSADAGGAGCSRDESGEPDLEHSTSERSGPSASILTRAEERQYKWAIRRADLQMVARLGAGAYGEVWAGRWRRNDVAVKLLSRSEDSDKGKQDFLREMQLLSELRHPNIVRFLGACLDLKNMCILFEICERSLYDLLYKSSDEIDGYYLLIVLREVALGIYYLHHCEPPVLHLDLKSANVLLDEAGTAKVCDFGLSHVKEDAANQQDNERTGVGSPQWTAPEILRGGAYDEKADSYSFGVLMYEVLARQLPYTGEPSHLIIVGVITRMLDRPALTPEQAEAWPASLPTLMKECMAEDPAERPDVEAVLDVLEEVAPKDNRTARLSGVGPSRDVTPRGVSYHSPSVMAALSPKDYAHDHFMLDVPSPGSQTPFGYPIALGSPLGRSSRHNPLGSSRTVSEPGTYRGISRGGSIGDYSDSHRTTEGGYVPSSVLEKGGMPAAHPLPPPAATNEATLEDLEDAAIERTMSINQRAVSLSHRSGSLGSRKAGHHQRSVSLHQRTASISRNGSAANARIIGLGAVVANPPPLPAGWRVEDEEDGMRYSTGDEGGGGERESMLASSVSSTEDYMSMGSARVSSAVRASMCISVPQTLLIRVPSVERGRDGKLTFTISSILDGVEWSVLRQERDVIDLHRDLKETLRFLPPPPFTKSRWPRLKSAEAIHALAHKLESYLTKLANNGQWLTPDASVLRQFLQVPITQEQLKAKAMILEMETTSGLLSPSSSHPSKTNTSRDNHPPRYSPRAPGVEEPSPPPRHGLPRELLVEIEGRRTQSFQVGGRPVQKARFHQRM